MITSSKNPRLKDIRRWYHCKEDRAVLEGPHLVAAALDLGLPLDPILATPEWLESVAGAALARRLPRPPLLVAAEALAPITDADSPRGVLAVTDLPRDDGRIDLSPAGLALYVEGVQDPGNLGALARLAEAAGAAALATSPGTAHPNHPRALRASAGSLLRLPVVRGVTPHDASRLGAETPPRWLLLDSHATTSVYDPLPPGPWVVAVGAEGAGASRELRERCDHVVAIPLAVPVESLNVATAAAIALFELRRRELFTARVAVPSG